MKKLPFLVVLIIYMAALPPLEARALPRSKNSRSLIQNYFKAPLEMRERNEMKQRYENLLVRKSNTAANIPVYIITRSKPKSIQRTGTGTDDLFDDNGMIFVTKPKKRKELSYVDYNGRRSYDLSKRNRRKLMAMMNKELNRQLLKKTGGMRRDYEVDFTDLVS